MRNNYPRYPIKRSLCSRREIFKFPARLPLRCPESRTMEQLWMITWINCTRFLLKRVLVKLELVRVGEDVRGSSKEESAKPIIGNLR